jgi:hypothetical protein
MFMALAATTQTLAAAIRSSLENDPNLGLFFNPGLGGTMVVSLSNPQEMVSNNVRGLSLWLYRVVRDDERLNQPPRRETVRELRQPPLPVRLHYLVTPIASAVGPNGPELEQAVLGKAMQTLHDHSFFRGTDLQGDFAGTETEFHARLEAMSLEDITRVWSALDESYQLSVSYEVSVITIRSDRVESLGPVMVAVPQSGIIVDREGA